MAGNKRTERVMRVQASSRRSGAVELDEVTAAKVQAHDLAVARAAAAAARAAAAEADLDLVLAFVTRQGGYRGGEDAIMLRSVRARREIARARALPEPEETMIAVDQTTFGFPGGNCFSACLASILELPIDDVPYFMGDSLEDDGGAWFKRFEEWLAPRNLYPVCFRVGDGWRPEGLHILSGKSPRALASPKALHSVVARGRDVVHDPHPSRAGVLSHDDVVLLVPLDPIAPVPRGPR